MTAIAGPRGLLWMLDAIVNRTQRTSAVALFEEAMTGYGPIRLESYVTVLGAAIVMYEAPMAPHEVERMQAMREIVKNSLQKGEEKYARPIRYDQMLSILYPRLRERLQSKKGTQESVMKIRRLRDIQQRQQEKQVQETQEAQRQEQAAQALQDELNTRFNEVTLQYAWLPQAGWPHDLPTTLMHIRREIGRGEEFYGLQSRRVLESAWQAREDKKSLVQWLKSEGVRTGPEVHLHLRLLDIAWMLDKKTPPRVNGH